MLDTKNGKKPSTDEEVTLLQSLPAETLIQRPKHQKFGLVWGGTILLLLSSFLIFITSQSGRNSLIDAPTSPTNQSGTALNTNEPPIEILPVETQPIQLVDSRQSSRTYTGEIVARRSSDLAFERSGKVLKINVDQGQRVQAGTPLASLGTSGLEASRSELLAQRAQAVAQLKEMQAGSRPETIAAARANLAQAVAELKERQAGPRAETIAAARANVTELDKQLELSRKKQNRRQSLYGEGAISREQLDEAITEVSAQQARLDQAQSQLNELLAGTRPERIEAQKARVDQAQKQLDELLAGTRPERIEAQKARVDQLDASLGKLKLDLKKTTLKAPFSGTISRRWVDEGTVVSTAGSQPIFSIVEDGAVEANIGIPVSAASQLQLGSTLPLKIGQKTYPAQVSSILPELDSDTRTVTVVLKLDPAAARTVAPGQLAQLELAQSIPTSGYWLPTTALVPGVRGLWSCYVLGEAVPLKSPIAQGKTSFRVERTDVEILYQEDDPSGSHGQRVLVRGTLQPGDQVIISGMHRIVPGQFVRPIQQ
ncbi:MAG: efflux RND transporter periplasmic adaptor subunit [Moorea sp. SIOASIH]|uniref:efflux RND transporter periplasmic adaptor subunit n=1 Tax=Moorena sp. SIOASIH TaxID=2607817 RepID=UPI0013BE7BB1|nr:efflux RND transporter periplasmic adaptor subunit [Moorena sp. SIOASIH]NEO36810.1 efflux RND transporter periplasmic adaptor subunit [Moorena sp. SIOASIH]